MKTPSSLMIIRSVECELPGVAPVRPAIQLSSWKPPLTAMSQQASPLAPQADQARMASSTSVRGIVSCSEVNSRTLRSWRTVFPDDWRVSGLPLSME